MSTPTRETNAKALPEPTPALHPDAELLALGPEIDPGDLAYKQCLCATNAAELADYDAAMEAQYAADEVVLSIRDEKIVPTRAHTLDGLIFKARYAATHFKTEYDGDVMVSIVDDLLALADEASPDEGTMTITSVAEMDFDPISAADVDALRLKAEVGWCDHLFSVQEALAVLGMTKDELKTGLRKSQKEFEAKHTEDWNPIGRFDASTEFMQTWVEVMDKAKWRTVVVGAALDLAEEASR